MLPVRLPPFRVFEFPRMSIPIALPSMRFQPIWLLLLPTSTRTPATVAPFARMLFEDVTTSGEVPADRAADGVGRDDRERLFVADL